jgi:CubicO group peptidase (beta-lactamase class C family)
MSSPRAMNQAQYPACGSYADGFEEVARVFTSQLLDGSEIGAGLSVYHHGERVVNLWGGIADVRMGTPWQEDTRAVLFSITKGLTAMGLQLLADRGRLDWDAPVAACWPAFDQAGKASITLRTLLQHRAGLAALDEPLTLEDCVLPERREKVRQALERQRPSWEPGKAQGYHAVTFGMYAREVFERLAGEPIGAFLQREFFDPLGARVSLGTPSTEDARIATLYPPGTAERVGRMLLAAARGDSTEGRVARAALAPGSVSRRAFLNPSPGARGMLAYNDIPVRRAELAWASATGCADGVARAYLPFALGGRVGDRSFFRPAVIDPLRRRQSWSERDLVMQKPLGFSQGFVKEDRGVFSPHTTPFGHPGMGGALGWCDPDNELTIGYVMNHLDWRVRSPRALALCRALYESEQLRHTPA